MDKITRKEKVFAFLYTFLIKLVLLFILSYFLTNGNFDINKLYTYGGDTISYLSPMRNYIEKGTYVVEKNGIEYFAVRPPHYTISYYLLNKIGFNDNTSFNLIVLFQVLINSLSVVLLASLIKDLCHRKYIFYLSLIVLSLTSSMSYFNQILLPESLVISFLTIALYLILKYYTNKKISYLFVSSFLMAFAVQLRPYIVLSLLIPYLYILLIFLKNKDYKFFLSNTLMSGLAMLIIFLPWTFRNYKIYHTFAPYDYKILDYYYGENYESSLRLAKVNLLKSFGESDTYWDTKSMSSFFESDTSEFKKVSLFKFNTSNFSPSISIQNYRLARKLYLEAIEGKTKESEIKSKGYFNNLTKKYKEEKPFNYYVLSKLKLIKNMIIHNGTYFLPFTFNQISPYTIFLKIWKISEFILYKLLLLCSFFGVAFCLFQKRHEILLVLIPISVMITSVIIGGAEYRYFTLAYPVLFIFAFLGFDELLKKVTFFYNRQV